MARRRRTGSRSRETRTALRAPLRGRLARLVLTAAALGASACTPPGPPDGRPNVLLVTVDTLRADRLGSYGFALDTSPNVDALAEQGVVFTRAVAASSLTAPSHASILTSRYVRGHTIGYSNEETRLEGVRTLAEAFREADRPTAAFVSNFVLRRRIGLDRGFDTYDDELPSAEINRSDFHERIAEATTRKALAWLQTVGPDPFFLWVHYQDPHGPYAPPPDHVGRFRLEPQTGEADPELPFSPGISGWGSIPRYQVLEGLRRPSQYEGRYADEIFYADRWIGTLLRAVDEHASGRPAVVLLTSDHGESLGEGNHYFSHGFATTPQLAHVPMILRAPGIAPAHRRGVVSHVDVMPTLLELAGLALPAEADGLALGPYLREGRPLPGRFVYCDIGTEISAYHDDAFVRVLGLKGAWPRGWEKEPPEDPPSPGHAWHYVWNADGSWTLDAADEHVDARIRAYFSSAVPMARADPLLPSDVENLRALGYVE